MAGSKKGQGKGRKFVVNPGKTADFYRKHPESAQHHRDVESARSSTSEKKNYRAELQAKARKLKIDGKGMVKPGSKKTPQDITHPNLTLGSRKKNRRKGGVHKA
tara:strand:+ start:78 stop:389 length:312 start_codon:yes stop_codon:yes gene_type:complete